MISDRDKQHRRLPYMIIFNIIGCIGFALFLVMKGFGGMAVAAALYGFFIVGGSTADPDLCRGVLLSDLRRNL